MCVIVKGMEVPKDCFKCKFLKNRNGNCWCNALESGMRFEEILNGRRDDCPIVEQILCKDCVWYCDTFCAIHPRNPKHDDDFCSRAERKKKK